MWFFHSFAFIFVVLLFRWFLKRAVGISLSRNNYLVFVMKTMCVFCDVLTEMFMCEIKKGKVHPYIDTEALYRPYGP